jgi:hypothetical protein
VILAYPSRLDTWTQCPRRYRFHYLDQPRPARRGAWAHQTLGAATHAALARWWQLADRERTPARVSAEVGSAWTVAGFADEAMSDRWRVRATAMVAAYVAAESERRAVLAPHGLAEPRRVEASVAMRVSDSVALMGRPDRVDERPSSAGTELVVVDYKTSRRPLGEHDARTSRTLAVYAAAAEATLGTCATRVELHHLPTGEVQVWRHDRESRDRQVARAAAVAEECRAVEARLTAGEPSEQLFPPSPGPLCSWCDYRDSCPEGIGTGPAAQPWAGLEPDGGSGEDPALPLA